MHQRSVCGINREDVDTEFRVGMFTRLLSKAAECPWSELFVNLSACYFGFLKLTNATLTRFSEELPPLVWAICKGETSTLCLSPSPLIQFQIAQARQHQMICYPFRFSYIQTFGASEKLPTWMQSLVSSKICTASPRKSQISKLG